jgi:hypothetical protein
MRTRRDRFIPDCHRLPCGQPSSLPSSDASRKDTAFDLRTVYRHAVPVLHDWFSGAERYSRGHSIVSRHSMEPGGSSPNSQELSTCPCPKPHQSSPHHPIISFQYPSYYYPPTNVLDFLMVAFLLAFPPINYVYAFIFSPFVLHAPPISSTLTKKLN